MNRKWKDLREVPTEHKGSTELVGIFGIIKQYFIVSLVFKRVSLMVVADGATLLNVSSNFLIYFARLYNWYFFGIF